MKQIEKKCKGQGEICLIGDCFKKRSLTGEAIWLSESEKSKKDNLECFWNVIAMYPKVYTLFDSSKTFFFEEVNGRSVVVEKIRGY